MKRILFLAAFAGALSACGVSKPAEVMESEKVVEVGYGTEVQQNITTPVSSVNTAENVTYRDIYEMIKGQCPGVQVNGNRILIRGVSSVNSGTDPLFVVNGSPVSDISNINPNEVKSISVLKDSAASIYGTRGANGVILITLK